MKIKANSSPTVISITDLVQKTPKMRAVLFENHGGVDELTDSYLERPRPEAHEVLVKVKACALNHLDIWNLHGMPGAKISMPHVLGCDVAGEVVELGKKVKGIRLHKPVVVAPGIRCGKCDFCKTGWDSLCPSYKILGFQVNGGYAEYVKVPAENIIPVSDRLSYEEWASMPLVFLTAWHMLVTRAQLKKRETVLIHAAGSGVGSAGIQIAKYLGAHVITTAGSDEKLKRAKSIGADEAINYRKKDFVSEVYRLTRGRGVDVVLEHIGPETFSKSLSCLVKKGRLVTCGVTSGPTLNLDLRFVFVRQLAILGCYMGGLHELKKVIRLAEKKKIKPIVDKVFPLREARSALERMQARQNFGKIVLTP
jgi:NADPH:quinone reductase-like Zn-dependent oxidoreductase